MQFLVTKSRSHRFVLKDVSCISREITAYMSVIETQLAWVVEHYFTRSYAKVQELFQGEFTDVTPLCKTIILSIVNKFCTEYSALNKLPKREKVALTPQKVEEIRKSVLATSSFRLNNECQAYMFPEKRCTEHWLSYISIVQWQTRICSILSKFKDNFRYVFLY